MKLCRGFDLSVYFLLNLPAEDPVALAREAIAGGVTAIQLRGKDASTAALYEVALALLPLTREHHVALLLNDRLDVALAIGADGVHLGRDDLPVDVVRRLAPSLILGASCYGSLDRAREMKAAGADYLAFGSVFASPTKPQAPVIGVEVFRDAQALSLPLVAIGGITPEQIPALAQVEVDGAAVITAIQAADDPASAAADFARAWRLARSA